METGKTAKYFKYAIGEIILVVIGILIALQINNWNENRKLNEQRRELISNMTIDFTTTNNNLAIAIEKMEGEISSMEAFYNIIKNEKQTISVDSLRELSRVFFAEDNFKPNISSYNEAVSNGDLKLLKNRMFTESIETFFESMDSYRLFFNWGGENYFNGGVWELRKNLGSLQSITEGRNSFTGIPYRKLSYNEFIATINDPLTSATFENGYTIKRNLTNHLKIMKRSCDEIVKILNKLD